MALSLFNIPRSALPIPQDIKDFATNGTCASIMMYR